jgi:hypothetical protein
MFIGSNKTVLQNFFTAWHCIRAILDYTGFYIILRHDTAGALRNLRYYHMKNKKEINYIVLTINGNQSTIVLHNKEYKLHFKLFLL